MKSSGFNYYNKLLIIFKVAKLAKVEQELAETENTLGSSEKGEIVTDSMWPSVFLSLSLIERNYTVCNSLLYTGYSALLCNLCISISICPQGAPALLQRTPSMRS